MFYSIRVEKRMARAKGKNEKKKKMEPSERVERIV